MSAAVPAWPLAWPPGYPRTPAAERVPARFGTRRDGGAFRALTVAEARARLADELDLLRATHIVLSSNEELRLDGQPRHGQREPPDPGVAVYFQLRRRPTVMPCDAFTTVAGNVAAIAGFIEALRAQQRYRVGTVEQAFAGFQAIRGPGPKPWREVLGFRAGEVVTRELVQAKRRDLARRLHPDAGGSDAALAEVNAAADAALEEVGDG